MPTVPTTFVPQVAPQAPGEIGQFQAPGVQPMENLAGPQVARFGQAMTAAGNAAFRLGSAIQDGIDDATTKQADVLALRGMQQVSDRYMATLGSQSESDFEASMGQLSQAGAAAMDTLKNDTQRSMFAPILARNMTTFQSRMTQHRNSQVRVWNINEATARSETMSDMAVVAYSQRNRVNPMTGQPFGTADFEVNLGVAIKEAENAASLTGIAGDSEQMAKIRQTVRDKVASGVVSNLLAEKQFAEAEAFLDSFEKQADLDPKVRESIRSGIDKNRQFTVVEELTSSIIRMGYPASDADPQTYPRREKPAGEPQTLREAMDIADGIEDMETRRAVQTRLRATYAQEEAMSQDAYNDLLDRTEQAQAAGNPLTPEMLAGLKPKDFARIMRGEQARTDANIEYQLADNPMLAQDPAWMRQNMSRMSLELRTKIRAEQSKPQAVIEASYDTDMLKRSLFDAGLGGMLASDKPEDKRAYVTLSDNVKKAISRAQTLSGGKLNDTQKQDIIDRAIMFQGTAETKRSLLGMDFLWPDKSIDLPLAMMTPEQKREMVAGSEFVMYGGQQYKMDRVIEVQEYLRMNGIAQPTLREVLEYITLKDMAK